MIREYLLQIILIAEGLLLLTHTMLSLARKKLTETISMLWGFISIVLIVAGLVLLPFDWTPHITPGALIIVALAFTVLVQGTFYLSCLLSYTMRKTQELAIQISLLNQEHIKVDYYLSSLSGQPRNQIWRTETVAEPVSEQAEKEDVLHEECSVCH